MLKANPTTGIIGFIREIIAIHPPTHSLTHLHRGGNETGRGGFAVIYKNI